jgi:nicotinamidase-related amidase
MQPISTESLVHLCLDMQRLFAADGPWPTPWMENVMPAIAHLCEHMPERTVFTRFIPPHHAEEATGMWQAFYRRWPNVTLDKLKPELLDLVPELGRFVPPAHCFDKKHYSAFADGRLAPWLAARSVSTLIVTGAETDICVLSTVMGAVDHGFRTILVTDAICSSSDEGHDALMRMYRERLSIQIELATATEALEALT